MNEKWKNLLNKLFRQHETYNPFTIAEKEKIPIMYVPFGEKPLGETVQLKNETVILINDCLMNETSRYFVAAHELFHALFHDNLNAYYISQKNGKHKLERESNVFAISLLIKLYEEDYGFTPETFDYIASSYGVPSELENDFMIHL